MHLYPIGISIVSQSDEDEYRTHDGMLRRGLQNVTGLAPDSTWLEPSVLMPRFGKTPAVSNQCGAAVAFYI